MADLRTTFCGIPLKNPLIAGASPFSKELDSARKLEDAGVSAIVMYSLFEEQINHENHELDHYLQQGTDSYAESLSYFPEPASYANIDAEDYLKSLTTLKKTLKIPVFASLNGVSKGGWMSYAKAMESAGADGIELNIFYIPTDPKYTSSEIEQMYIDGVKAVKESVKIPVALKVGASFTALSNFATRLESAGVDGLVIFNRFFGPDIDLAERSVSTQLKLSTRDELVLPLRWIAILEGILNISIAATSGVHDGLDVLKVIMAGADVAQVASAFLKRGPEYAGIMLSEMEKWMKEHEFDSISEMKGSMGRNKVENPAAYERGNYMKMLQSYS